MLKWLQQLPRVSFLHISSILSASCDRSQSWTREWTFILRMRHPTLPYTKRPFRSMWRVNTGPNINMCRSMNTKAYRAAHSSSSQWRLDPVDHPSIHMICPAMMKYTERLPMWPRQHPDKEITQHTYWPPPNLLYLNSSPETPKIWGKSFQLSMVTTRPNGDSQYILDTGHYWLVAPTRGIALQVSRSLQCGTQSIHYNTTWCRSGGKFFPCARCYWLEAVENHRRGPLRKCCCQADCSSQ